MKIWGISDTHLSGSRENGMIVHGAIWVEHKEQIIKNWQKCINRDDIVLICGDISWSNTLKQAMQDICILSELPGKAKIMVKGNHDHWWEDYNELSETVPKDIRPLSANAINIEGHVFCGTMGWLSLNDPCSDSLDAKFFHLEMDRLVTSLQHAIELNPEHGIHLLMHFPPFTTGGIKTPFLDIIAEYPVTTCTFGHSHFPKEWECIPQGNINGTVFRLTSTDFLKHKPVLIWED